MSILNTLKERFHAALSHFVDDTDDLLQMIRPANNPEHGDYQANCAMPLSKKLGIQARDLAEQIVARLEVDDICDPPEIAGPGFINMRFKPSWLAEQLGTACRDERLGVTPVEMPRTYVVDFSSPNVAKPMHVGHIRSTAIGDALTKILRFAGHHVISDNHLGDWGTQFGMIIYGYKHFVDDGAFASAPVAELSRLYRLVAQLVAYYAARQDLPRRQASLAEVQAEREKFLAGPQPEEKAEKKRWKKTKANLNKKVEELVATVQGLESKIEAIESNSTLYAVAESHPEINTAVLEETAKLHAGDAENLQLWHDFLPHCRDEIQKVYSRLEVQFDYEYGESFYHDQLESVVTDFVAKDFARESDGAMCVFLDDFDAPMIVQKKDGAYLYATTDLATIKYRMETWNPDAILYVVDHRQSEHFEKLFAAARKWGYDSVELTHISFGTVLGKDKKPFKTRSGDTVGLESLLDEAVANAYQVVSENDDARPSGPALTEEERKNVSQVVGHAAIKYADLSLNRTSDYVFDLKKMVELRGNTASYMQYSYARTKSIFERGGIDIEQVRADQPELIFESAEDRALVLELLKFGDAVTDSLQDYRPNILTDYLYNLAKRFAQFFESSPVLKAEEPLRASRLMLCDLTGRTLKQGLALLGISVVNKM